jgi:hypothetical protein
MQKSFADMRIISFDVGMKNLAYCIINTTGATQSVLSGATKDAPIAIEEIVPTIQLEKWDVIDLRTPPLTLEQQQQMQAASTPTYPTCSFDKKRAKYEDKKTHTFYCLACAGTKSKLQVPEREILALKTRPGAIKKYNMFDLAEFLTKHQESEVAGTPGIKRAALVRKVEEIVSKKYLDPVAATYENVKLVFPPTTTEGTSTIMEITDGTLSKGAQDVDLITYGRNLVKHLDPIVHSIDFMIIENQISTIASRMKTLQGMITQYFIMKGVPRIEFISSANKLKPFASPTTTYGDRKKLGVQITANLLTTAGIDMTKWKQMFESHKKKDDLADCFLQGLWRIHKGL